MSSESKATEAELDLAARVLDLARAAAGASAEVDVAVRTEELALTRFANSFIHQNVADRTTGVQVRIHVDGRTTTAGTTLTGPDDLAALVERAAAAAKLSPLDPGWAGLSPRTGVPAGPGPDERTAQASPADRAALVADFVAGAGGLVAAGYARTRVATAAYANSAGQAVSRSDTEAVMEGIARTATSDGAARRASRRIGDLDGAVLGSRAARKARAAQNPTDLAPGVYEVVLEPTAVCDLLLILGGAGFNGRAVNQGTSFARIGEAQFDPAVTLVDDPFAATAGFTFDIEGTPRDRLVLVEDGVTRGAAHDRRSAREAGVASTGHAQDGSAIHGAQPVNMMLVPSSAAEPVTEVDGPAGDSATEALVRGVGRGLLVTDHWYTRCLDPRRLVMTGLTRNGVWLVEDGEIVRPVKNLRFTQSYPEAMGPGKVLGIGSHTVGFVSKYGYETPMAPALRLAEWHFTGGSAG